MENNDAKRKLSNNTTRLVGFSVLRRIRTIVDDYEAQDKKNKQKVLTLSIVFFIFFALFLYFVFFDTPKTTILKTAPSHATNIQTFKTHHSLDNSSA